MNYTLCLFDPNGGEITEEDIIAESMSGAGIVADYIIGNCYKERGVPVGVATLAINFSPEEKIYCGHCGWTVVHFDNCPRNPDNVNTCKECKLDYNQHTNSCPLRCVYCTLVTGHKEGCTILQAGEPQFTGRLCQACGSRDGHFQGCQFLAEIVIVP